MTKTCISTSLYLGYGSTPLSPAFSSNYKLYISPQDYENSLYVGGNSVFKGKNTFSKSSTSAFNDPQIEIGNSKPAKIGVNSSGLLGIYSQGTIRLTPTIGSETIEESDTEWGVFLKSASKVTNVGIGVSNPTCALHVRGDFLATGGVTFYSQKSLKNIHETDFLSLDQLSNIHAIKYTWKDGRDDRMHVGGIADDIQKIIPEVIYENDGYLTMDYGNAGFVVSASLIKPVVDHEKRIKDLEAEVERLNNILNA